MFVVSLFYPRLDGTSYQKTKLWIKSRGIDLYGKRSFAAVYLHLMYRERLHLCTPTGCQTLEMPVLQVIKIS